MNILRKCAMAIVAFLSVSVAQAELIDRGDGFIYDDVLNITWTQNASIDSASRSWYDRTAGAADLSLIHNGTVYDDWRLPSMDLNGDRVIVYCSIATEVECRDNELGYMFIQYGVSPTSPGLFTNVELNYWSSTDYDADGWTCNSGPEGNCAWRQGFGPDSHNYVRKVYGDDGVLGYGGWAVRDGDVLPVTEPVAIHIKPGSEPVCNGAIPVAILGSDTLDVTQIDPTSLVYEGLDVRQRENGSLSCRVKDVNGDDYADFVCQYQDTTTEGTLTGALLDGTPIEGADTICVVN